MSNPKEALDFLLSALSFSDLIVPASWLACIALGWLLCWHCCGRRFKRPMPLDDY